VAVAPFVPSVRVVRGGAQSSVIVDQSYDLVIDQQLYPATDVPGAGNSSVPSPDSDDSGPASGGSWPQAIPPVRTTPATSDASAGSASEPGVEPLKVDEGQKVEPVGPQPSRGTRASSDTIFAQRAGRVVYPTNASMTVATPVRRVERRITASKATQQSNSGQKVTVPPATRAAQGGVSQASRQSYMVPRKVVGLASVRSSAFNRTSLPAMVSPQSNRVSTGAALARGQSRTVIAHEPISVPGLATLGRTST